MNLKNIAKTLVWWEKAEKVSLDYLVLRVMDIGTWEMVKFIEKKYGNKAFIRALERAKKGDLSIRSLNYWKLVLKK